ncbi:MAG: ABC transporter substrate-binding protein [Pseudomonadota bacterium]
MKRVLASAAALAVGVSMSFGAAFSADKPEEITVAYFLEWPTANQVAQLEKTYDKELGVKVNWRAFGNGNEMTQAMASGKVQIAYSQGLVPYVVAASSGLPLQLVGVAVSYAEADNCVVSKASGITKKNAKELEGKKVGTPIGNVTHYKLLRMLDHLGVDATKVNMVQMNGADAAVAFARGDIVMGCAFGGPMLRMKETGEYLMTAKEQEDIGIRVFDVISVTKEFADKHPELVQKFIDVTDKANAAYYKDKAAALPKIAKAAGMDKKAADDLLKMFSFPSKKDQASDAWLGGTVQKFTKEVADFFVEQKQMDKALPSYDANINAKFVKN